MLSTKYSQSNISKLSTKQNTVRGANNLPAASQSNFNKTHEPNSNKRSQKDESDLVTRGEPEGSNYTL